MPFIVEIPNGGQPYWLAAWSGDPGRTVIRTNAQQFDSQGLAEAALTLAQKRWPERKSLLQGLALPSPTESTPR